MPILDWLDRDRDVRAAESVPYRLLESVESLSCGDPAAPNMLIQGDNLEALKALLPYYSGQVKCIFIDPPYNTRSAFEHYDDNLEHSQWLSMMYPRLELLRELLSEDGSIWVTIDDNEVHYLKVIMDEIFGRKNFLSNFIWKKSYGGGAKAKHFVGLHEHVLGYAKNLDTFPELFLPPDESVLKYYKFTDEKLNERGPYRLQPLATNSMDERPNLRYAIIADDGYEIWPQKQWQWSRERALSAQQNNELVIVKKSGKYTVSYKQYLKDKDGEERRTKPKSIIDGIYTQHGTKESVELFGQEDKFSFPKPEKLIWTIFEACSAPNDLVLDSFLGSGTTAAVAHKMGRRYIGVEMGEHAITHCQPRLKKVIEGEQGGISEAVGWTGGGGFRFYKLGAPIFDAEGNINPAIRFPHLAAHIWFCETRTAYAPAKKKSPLLGVHNGTAYYLLYNGILGDRTVNGGNVLTHPILKSLPPHHGPKVIYGETSRLSPERLRSLKIVFKQTPYDVKAR
ncbi:MAG: site-specific DNA-methyltransferase [Alphaproteobacteria bacterium]|nr:site-specific DNA-methyltransferase [Alphaproteobacteria bacterium]QQS57932.1 MAG: site-specific DNA-methyltransferase [Alphaproteobacteria bacterium]